MADEQCHVHENGVCALHGKLEERRKNESKLIDHIPQLLSLFQRIKAVGAVALLLVLGAYSYTLVSSNIARVDHAQSQADIAEIRALVQAENANVRAYVDMKTNQAIARAEQADATADAIMELMDEVLYNLKAYLKKQEDFEYTEIKSRRDIH